MWIYSQSIFSNNHEFLRPAIELQTNEKSPSFNPYASAGFQKTPKRRDLETDPLWHHTGHIYIRHLPVRSVTTPLAWCFPVLLNHLAAIFHHPTIGGGENPVLLLEAANKGLNTRTFWGSRENSSLDIAVMKSEIKNSYIISFRNTKLTVILYKKHFYLSIK